MLRQALRNDPLLVLLLLWQVTGLSALLLKPQYLWLILLALVASHLLVILLCLCPCCRWPGPLIKSFEHTGQRQIYLTFDDGPDPVTTATVMEILDEYGIKASFFCIGKKAEQYPLLIKQLASSGHQIENHSWSHTVGFFFLSWPALSRQIIATTELIETLTGYKPVYFRAPAGIRNPMLQLMLKIHGLYLAGWTRRGYDTLSSDGEKILKRLLRNVKSGDILLLHDGSSACDRNNQAIVITVLPRLLDTLLQKGFKITHLPKLHTRHEQIYPVSGTYPIPRKPIRDGNKS